MLAGSRAYNLATPSSDKDVFAVYSASPHAFWVWWFHLYLYPVLKCTERAGSADAPRECNWQNHAWGHWEWYHCHGNRYTVVEWCLFIGQVGKFCSLLISGNPTIIEALYASNNSEGSTTWDNVQYASLLSPVYLFVYSPCSAKRASKPVPL